MEEWYKHHKLHDVLQTGSITTLDLPLVLSCRRDIVIGRFEFDLQPLAELDRGRRLNYRHCFVIQNGTFWTFYTFLHSEIPIWRCCLNQLQNWSVLKIWVATPTQSSARLPLFGHPWRPAFLKKSLMQDAMSANKPFFTNHGWTLISRIDENSTLNHWEVMALNTHSLWDLVQHLCSGVQKQQVWMSWCPDVWCLEATTKAFKAAGSADISHLKTHRNGCEMRAISETQDAVKYVKINQEFPLVIAKGFHSASTGIDRLNQQFLNPGPLPLKKNEKDPRCWILSIA